MVVLTAGFILQSITIEKHISLMQKVDFRRFFVYISYVLFVCIRMYACVTCTVYPYVVRLYPYVTRMLSVCYYPYVFRICPYVVRVYPYVTLCCPYVTRMLSVCIGMSPVCCPYVFRMLSVCYLYVPLCIREASVCYSAYVTRLCPCVFLVKIGCRTELTILLLFSNGHNSK